MKHTIILTALFLSIPAFAGDAAKADKPTEVKAPGTVDCNKTPSLHIAKGSLKLVLTGNCTSVSVAGGKNEIIADSIVALDVAGASNKITVSKVDTLKLNGAKNEITWTGTVDSTKTDAVVTDSGKENVIKKGDQAAFDAAKAAVPADINAKGKKAEKDVKKGADDAAKAVNGVKLP